jgi:glycosyltransferase involved in cell wall biosynthesis
MLNRLSLNFDITVFCETPIDKSWLSYERNYKLVSTSFRFLPFRINNVFFFVTVLWHYLVRRYDVIHAHSTYPTGLTAVILQRIFGVPSVVSLDGEEGIFLSEVDFGDLKSNRRTRINKWILNRATVANTLTNFHRVLIESNLNISRMILVIPRGVDQNTFRNRRDLGIQTPIRFVSAGYLSPVKDPVTLVRTFHFILQTTPSTLTIVGKDYMHGAIQKLAAELGVGRYIRFLEHVDHKDMTSIYEDADILLLTSRYESQGMVVAEAMAAGVLVCGTNVGLINDLAEECCLSAPVGDDVTLAQRVVQLIGDPNRMWAMQKKAYEWASAFTLEKTAERWSEVYTMLIEKKK